MSHDLTPDAITTSTLNLDAAFVHPQRRHLWERSLIGDATLDAGLLASLWHPQGSFQIGAMPQVKGQDAIRGFLERFFSMGLFTRLDHELLEVWDLEAVLIYTATALYTRADGSVLRVPYTNTVKYQDGLFADYRVYIDTAPLMAR